jgi:hypothetical protein
VHKVKLRRWHPKQDMWLPRQQFLTALPSVLPHMSDAVPALAEPLHNVSGASVFSERDDCCVGLYPSSARVSYSSNCVIITARHFTL